MKRNLFLLAVLLVAMSFPGIVLFAADEEEKAPVSDCCFEHPNFQGTCTVTPAGEETCASILDYLNTAGTANKTYCGTTRLRGGWSEVKCQTEEPQQNSTKSQTH